jgi:hypothetical protein
VGSSDIRIGMMAEEVSERFLHACVKMSEARDHHRLKAFGSGELTSMPVKRMDQYHGL